jgi:hypothetical protein
MSSSPPRAMSPRSPTTTSRVEDGVVGGGVRVVEGELDVVARVSSDGQRAKGLDGHTTTNYAIFYSGLGMTAVQLDENDYATIPSNLQGIYYVVMIHTAQPA